MTKAQRLEKAVKCAEAIAADNSHGYSNVVGDNYGQNGEFDCGGLISYSLQQAGIITNGAVFEPNEEYGNPWSYGTVLYPLGFKRMKFDAKKVKRGDILIKDGHHTELANSNTTTVGAHDNFDGRRGDWETGNEIGIAPIYPGYWDYMLRLDTQEEKKEDKSMFKDVPTTDKNYKIYKWAAKNGLLSIDKNGNFNPAKTVKKKHIAIILYRFYKFLKK